MWTTQISGAHGSQSVLTGRSKTNASERSPGTAPPVHGGHPALGSAAAALLPPLLEALRFPAVGTQPVEVKGLESAAVLQALAIGVAGVDTELFGCSLAGIPS